MPTFNFDDVPEPDDGLSGWHFDPDDPPETFSMAMLGRMTIGDIRRCNDPEWSPLNPDQQASFDVVHTQWSEKFSERIGSVVMPALSRVNPVRVPQNFFPKMPTAKEVLGFDTEKLLGIQVPRVLGPQFEAARTRLIADLDLTRGLTAPRTRSQHEEGTESQSYQQRGTEGTPVEELDAPPDVQQSADRDMNLTSNTLELRIGHEVHTVESIVALAETMRRQAELSARGWVFYVLVGMAATLGGVAAVASLDTWPQRFWVIVITAGIGLVALIAYFVVRGKQRSKLGEQPPANGN